MSYIKIAKSSVFLSIIFFSLFILYNFSNALQILDQYISQYGQPVIVTDWDPSFMPPYYGPTPGGVIDVNQYGQITGGYSPVWDMTLGPVPGDYVTSWGVYPNWENRWLLGAAGMYGPDRINFLSSDYGYRYSGWSGYQYTGGGGPYWIFGDNPNPGPFFGTAYTGGGFLGVGDLPPIL